MADNYNVLANYIVQKYVDRITGKDIVDGIIGEDPAKRVMTGMLAENRVEQSLLKGYVENTSTRFQSVPSMTLSFIVDKNENGILKIKPQGLLFYSVEVPYKEAVDFVLKRYSGKNRKEYTSITDIINECPDEKIPFPAKYQTVRIEDEIKESIEIHIGSQLKRHFSISKEINEQLTAIAEKLMDKIVIYQKTHINLSDLSDEKQYRIVSPRRSDEKVFANWKLDILCNVTDLRDKWQISLQMVNKTLTQRGTTKNIGYIPRFFNAGMSVEGNADVHFTAIPLDYFKNSFRKKPVVYAVAENTSATYHPETNTIQTENVPIFYQHRLKTNDSYDKYLTFDTLLVDPLKNLNIILTGLKADLKEREADAEKAILTDIAKDKLKQALIEYRSEIERFELGIRQISGKELVRKAFECMNRTFRMHLSGEVRGITGWRLFQIVFIVSMIPEVIRSEYPDDPELKPVDIPSASLLYFPTGGGKTEAFLGITVLDMFFDRFRGKTEGVTAILKYPLRLLAVQQLDRILTVVMKANLVKQEIAEIKSTTDFRLGFYVGKVNTPNRISVHEPLSSRGSYQSMKETIIEAEPGTLDDYYKFIDTCPICGEKTVHVSFNRDTWTLEHRCENPNCNAGTLPVYIVDDEIYRYLPSIIVCTIDKMALLGINSDFKMLMGQVKSKCPVHGFSAGTKCSVSGCKIDAKRVGLLKDPVPSLFIQDELHLVKESLGTFDAHYESFIDYYARKLVPQEQQKQIRYIGATATISQYKEHIQNLYHMNARRFPCEYPALSTGKDFYSYIDTGDITRIILGYAPYGRSITDGVWESIYLMREVIYLLMTAKDIPEPLRKAGFSGTLEEYREMLYNYWVELIYHNKKQDANDLQATLQNQGNNLLEEKNIPLFSIEQMTSDVDFQQVRKTLFSIQENHRNLDSTNIILATSTISHGVDEDSFNVMFFYGMPSNNAEYIQAYSRSGRKYPGIIVDIIRLMQVRDRSYLKNFILFHENKDELVEPVPINRWARNAIYSTLPGILAGMIIQYYSLAKPDISTYKALSVKELLNAGIVNVDDAVERIIQAYGCSDEEKSSIFYRSIIREEVVRILNGLKNETFSREDWFSNAISKYSHGRKQPMLSLRDTEEQIEIEVKR